MPSFAASLRSVLRRCATSPYVVTLLLMAAAACDSRHVNLGDGSHDDLHPRLADASGPVDAQRDLRVAPDLSRDLPTPSPWEKVAVNAPQFHFGAIGGTSATDIWVVGSAKGGQGIVLRHDGTSFRDLTPKHPSWAVSPRAISCRTPTDIWLAGANGTGLAPLWHYDGTAWTPHALSSTSGLTGVWAASSTDVWAIGILPASVYRYEGGQWNAVVLPDALKPLSGFGAIWGSSATDVWMLGFGPGGVSFVHFDGLGWSIAKSNVSLRGLGGSGANDVWAVGGSTQSVLRHFDGTWSAPQQLGHGTLYGVFAPSPAVAIAVGSEGTILRRSGSSWLPEDSGTSQTLYAAWGASANDVWVVGFNGTILRRRTP